MTWNLIGIPLASHWQAVLRVTVPGKTLRRGDNRAWSSREVKALCVHRFGKGEQYWPSQSTKGSWKSYLKLWTSLPPDQTCKGPHWQLVEDCSDFLNWTESFLDRMVKRLLASVYHNPKAKQDLRRVQVPSLFFLKKTYRSSLFVFCIPHPEVRIAGLRSAWPCSQEMSPSQSLWPCLRKVDWEIFFSSKKSLSNSDHSFVSFPTKVLSPTSTVLFYFVLICLDLSFDTESHYIAQSDPGLTILAHPGKCCPTSFPFALCPSSSHLHLSLALHFKCVELRDSLRTLNHKQAGCLCV